MGKYLVLNGDEVVNVVNFDPDTPGKKGWIADPGGVGIGWVRQGDGNFLRPTEASNVPRQAYALDLRNELRDAGLMTAVKREIPNLPENLQDYWNLSVVVSRQDEELNAIAAAAGISDAALDQVFRNSGH